MISFDEQIQMVKRAMAQFPKTFGLRAFPGKTFTINEAASYMSDYPAPNTIYLYTFVQDGDRWVTFCKSTPAELKREIRPLEGE